MAQVTGMTVKASIATPVYHGPKGAINFGEWEGTVLTYSRKGDVISVEYHSCSSDSHYSHKDYDRYTDPKEA